MSDELKAKVKTLQAAFVARELELEQVRSNAEARQVTLENQLGALQTQLQSLQTRIDSQQLEVDQVRGKNSQLVHDVEEKDRVIAELKRSLAAAEMESKSAQSLKNSLEEEVERKHKEMQLHSNRMVELNEKYVNVEKRYYESTSELDSLKLENSSLKRRLSNLEAENQRLSAEVSETTSLNSENVRELHSEITRLKLSLAEKDAVNQQMSLEMNLLRQKESQMKSEISELRGEINALITESNERLEIHNREVNSLQSVANLTKRSLSEKLEIIRELEHQLSSAVESKIALEKEIRSYVDQVEIEKSNAENELRKKDDEIQRLLSEIENLKRYPPIDESIQSPDNLSLSEVYQRYVSAAQLLQKERDENHQLLFCIEQMRSEIENQAPILSAQSEDFVRMRQAYYSLQQKLLDLKQERDRYKDKEGSLSKTLEVAEKKITSLEMENNDISRQLSHILKVNASEKTGRNSAFLGLPSSLVFGDSSVSSSKDLVLFEDVDELLKVNQKLREEIRSLNEELSSIKEGHADYANSLLSQKVTEKNNEFTVLKEKCDALESDLYLKDQELIALRAVCRKELLALPSVEGSDTSHEAKNSIVSASTEQSQLRVEYEKLQAFHERTIKEEAKLRSELNQTIENMRDANSDLRLKLNRVQIDLEHTKKSLEGNEEENKSIRSQLTAVQSNASEQSKLAIQLQEQLSLARRELSSISKQLQNAISEANVSKYSLQALEKEKSDIEQQMLNLRRESSMKEQILEELSSVKAYLSAEHSKEREQWFGEKRDLVNDKERLSEQLENERTLRFKAARDNAASLQQQSSMRENLLAQIEELRISLSNKESEVGKLSSQLDDVRNQLQKSQSQIDVLIHHRRISRVEAPDLSSNSFSTLSHEQQLQMELQFSRDEAERIANALLSASEEARSWKQIAKQNDEKLVTLSKTHQECVELFQNQVEKLSRNRDLFKSRLLQAKEVSQALEKRYLDLELSHQKEIEGFRISLKELQELNAQLRSQAEPLEKQVSDLVAKLKRQVDLTKEAQSRYERELLDHAAHIKITSDQQLEIESLESEKAKLIRELNEVSSSLSEKDLVRSSFEQDLTLKLEESQKLLEVLRSENQLLVSSLENVNSGSDSSETVQIVIERLRLQKELAEAEKESLSMEILRLKDAMNLRNSSIKQLQVELESFRLSNSAVSSSASNNDLILLQLRESNSHLRSEKDNLLEQNAALKSRLASAESANEPFLQEIRDLKAQILALNAEKSVLQEEVSRWMKKVESLIHSYNQVDLAEYEQLQGEYKDLSDVNKSLVGKLEKLESLEMNFEKDSAAKLDHLKLEYETKLSLKQTEYDELKKSELGRAGRLSKTIKTQQSEIDNLKAELEAQAAALSTPAPTAQSQVQVGASPQEVKDLIDLIEKSKKLISELKEKVEKLQEELRLKSMENMQLLKKLKSAKSEIATLKAESSKVAHENADESPEAKTLATAAAVPLVEPSLKRASEEQQAELPKSKRHRTEQKEEEKETHESVVEDENAETPQEAADEDRNVEDEENPDDNNVSDVEEQAEELEEQTDEEVAEDEEIQENENMQDIEESTIMVEEEAVTEAEDEITSEQSIQAKSEPLVQEESSTSRPRRIKRKTGPQ